MTSRARPRWRKLPPAAAALVMPLVLSVLMTCIVSAVSTALAVGLDQDFVRRWPPAWGLSFVIGFPSLLLVLPLVRRIVAALVAQPA
jgi:hypothetical protein